jgi:hypothetical protein
VSGAKHLGRWSRSRTTGGPTARTCAFSELRGVGTTVPGLGTLVTGCIPHFGPVEMRPYPRGPREYAINDRRVCAPIYKDRDHCTDFGSPIDIVRIGQTEVHIGIGPAAGSELLGLECADLVHPCRKITVEDRGTLSRSEAVPNTGARSGIGTMLTDRSLQVASRLIQAPVPD